MPKLGADMLGLGVDMLKLGADMLGLGVDMPKLGADMLGLGAGMLRRGTDMLGLGADILELICDILGLGVDILDDNILKIGADILKLGVITFCIGFITFTSIVCVILDNTSVVTLDEILPESNNVCFDEFPIIGLLHILTLIFAFEIYAFVQLAELLSANDD
jgi:hypothetical protein